MTEERYDAEHFVAEWRKARELAKAMGVTASYTDHIVDLLLAEIARLQAQVRARHVTSDEARILKKALLASSRLVHEGSVDHEMTDTLLNQLACIEEKQDRILAILTANGIYNLNANQPTIEFPPRDDDAEVAAALAKRRR